jgi:phthalate 4,5-dioxygenase oxygenase subunit
MLKPEENELLSRVGPGTPMGGYMRQFWTPAIRVERLAPGGAPVRVRLLGQDFVAFRATNGQVGFFDEACPHRGASLALAHNEGDGLRCSYHGLKLGAAGDVLDMPCERPERRAEYAAKVRIGHYPVREAAKVIWVYLGEGQPPKFPEYNFMKLPADHVQTAVGLIHSNWLNGLEGQLDSAHVAILHQDWMNANRGSNRRIGRQGVIRYDTGPRFEFENTLYGYREAAVRKAPNDRRYVRVRDYVVPYYSFIPIGGYEDDHDMTVSVPIDDEHSAQWDMVYNLVRPLDKENSAARWSDPDDIAAEITAFGFDRNFGQDRTQMKEGRWTGFSKLRYEDFAVAMAQGIICNRSKEYLGMSDTSINRARRLLLDAVKRYLKGEHAFGTDDAIDYSVIRAEDGIIPADGDWRRVAREMTVDNP